MGGVCILHPREGRTRVLYVDLDGTVRYGFDELGRFVNGPEDVRVFDGVPAILRAYRAAGWRVVAVSNQGGVALGHISKQACAEAMKETYRQCDAQFDKMAFCMHHPDAKDPEYAVCWCRKPRAGLLVETAIGMAREHREYYPPHLSVFVGDRPEDKGCAEAANIPFMDAKDWRGGGWRQHVTVAEPLPPGDSDAPVPCDEVPLHTVGT
jgi:D-glycero-D-manno-heptose 1,7-bisphosphate phosphatase